MNLEIAFIGAGKMVSASLSFAWRTYKSEQIACCSANDGTSEKLSMDTGIARFESVDQMLEKSPRTLVLGCKPQQLSELPLSIAEKTEDCLILSIMAGITLKRLQRSFPKAKNIVRSMPNTPGQIGEGATGYFFLKDPESEDAETIQSILSSLGQTHLLRKEDELDLVTAISGSGPAYLFEFTCALEEAAREINSSTDSQGTCTTDNYRLRKAHGKF